jgi:hypothetical protein
MVETAGVGATDGSWCKRSQWYHSQLASGVCVKLTFRYFGCVFAPCGMRFQLAVCNCRSPSYVDNWDYAHEGAFCIYFGRNAAAPRIVCLQLAFDLNGNWISIYTGGNGNLFGCHIGVHSGCSGDQRLRWKRLHRSQRRGRKFKPRVSPVFLQHVTAVVL